MPAVQESIEVRVPDIGDFKDVPVIDVLVKPGDTVKAEDSLITLESDKASMDVPAPTAGVIQEVKVKVGDRVSQGSLILTLGGAATVPSNGASAAHAAAPAPAAAAPAAQPAPAIAASAEPVAEASAPSGGATIEVRVPDIGDFKDVPVIDVLVKVGDVVKLEDSLITLESDKASMDVPAPAAGTIASLALKVGDKVSQGALIGTITTGAATAARNGAHPAPPSAPAPTAAAPAPVAAAPVVTTAAPSEQHALPAAAEMSGGPVHAGPAVRRLARELGLSLAHVKGSGPHGRVTKDDLVNFVKRAVQAAPPAPAASGTGLNLAPWPKVDFAQYGPIEVKPLSRIKKISGPNLHRNWVMIPHVTNNEDADITGLEEFRQQVNAEQGASGAKLTILAFLIKAAVAALQKFPEFNASLDGDNLVLKRYYHIGFAADTPNGLVVPIVRDADKKGVVQIGQEMRDLAAKARDGKLTLAEMQGGTFTISSLGGIGGTYFTPIINAPEVAILGACRSTMRPVWDGKAFVPRLILPLSLSYDHRVIDGAAAARFNTYLANVLADMRRVML
ncbi:MAG TPA: dihydrolipoyllysine-residue acetyltransferase [Candidatus Acidoferrales bacterium]|nr:dihydrolipoyllysine-residue acetyltransferase [Candidatus Acidoferrales bacterium]